MQVYLQIYGQVQGVFFRSSAKGEAEKLGLVGWVRNNPDGSVEILAVGPKSRLEKFAAWCKKGPPFAKVEKVEADFQKQEQEFASFDIL